jgi:adenylate cyclase
LRIALAPAEQARLGARHTVRPESYLAYLRGLTLLRETSADSLQAAQRQFEIAISLDPTNAGAHGGLATATWLFGLWHLDPSRTDWVEKLRVSAARALQLDPNLPEAHVGMTAVLFREQDYAGMEREFKLALSLNPSHALAHNQYANILEFVGRGEEALTEFRHAETADPLWLLNLFQLASLLLWLGRFDEAWVTIEKIRELAPSDPDYHLTLGDFYFARSEVEKGLEEWRRGEAGLPEGRSKQIRQAWILARSGQAGKARAILRREETLPMLGQLPTNVAQIYAELGDLDECFRWLDKSFLAHDLPVMLIRLDPRYENIRRDPRYQTLMEKMNLA